MSFVSRFFRNVYRSSTSPEYYKEVVKMPFAASVRYYLGFFAILAACFSVVVAIQVARFDAVMYIEKGYDQLVLVYPEELEITVNNDGYSINQELPFAIKVPNSWQDAIDEDEAVFEFENLIVFTSDEEFSDIDNFWNYKSAIVLTETKLYAPKNEGRQLMVQPLSEFFDEAELQEPYVITKDVIASVPVEKLREVSIFKPAVYASAIGVFVFFFLFVFFIIWNAIKLVIYSFIVFIAWKMFSPSRSLTYGKVFQISIHAFTPLLLLSLLSFTIGIPFSGLLWLLLYLIWTTIIIGQITTKTPKNDTPWKADSPSPTPKKIAAKKRSPQKKTAKSTTTKKATTKKKSVAKKATPTKTTAKKKVIKKSSSYPKKTVKKPNATRETLAKKAVRKKASDK